MTPFIGYWRKCLVFISHLLNHFNAFLLGINPCKAFRALFGKYGLSMDHSSFFVAYTSHDMYYLQSFDRHGSGHESLAISTKGKRQDTIDCSYCRNVLKKKLETKFKDSTFDYPLKYYKTLTSPALKRYCKWSKNVKIRSIPRRSAFRNWTSPAAARKRSSLSTPQPEKQVHSKLCMILRYQHLWYQLLIFAPQNPVLLFQMAEIFRNAAGRPKEKLSSLSR